ncbi:MAG TPA: hypothetical protein VKR54_01010 [Candidatus Babeliales bacterium]|nr:hypothetical protein [Candidatus Babeliales bacterium]
MKNHKDNVGHGEQMNEKSKYFGNNDTKKNSCNDAKKCDEKKCHCGCNNCGCNCGCDDCNCSGKPKNHCCE